MIFEDPRVYLKNGNLYDYTIRLYNEYAPMAYDMYNKFIEKLNYPKCWFEVCMIGPTGSTGRDITNGLFTPPAKIQIYLLNIALTAYDSCITMKRTDFDTVMKASMAYTIIHEISHSVQNTYVTNKHIAGMEYANNKHVFDELIPQLELILKRMYKINIYTDRVDDYTNKVYSYPYNACSPADRILNLILYNSFSSDNGISAKDNSKAIEYRNNINSMPNIIISFIIFGEKMSLHIKQNGVYLDDNILKLLEFGNNIPDVYGFDSTLDQISDDTVELIYDVFQCKGYCPIFNANGDQFM